MNVVQEQAVLKRPAASAPGGLSRFAGRVRRGLRRRLKLCVRKLGKDHHVTLRLVKNEGEFGGARVLASLVNRETCFKGPVLYDQKLAVIQQPALRTKAPDLTLLELDSVTVVGGTMVVMRDGKLLHPELLHTKTIHDEKAADICRFADAERVTVNLDGYTRFGGRPRIRVGIHLLKEHSANFYHWLFECLPRLLHFREHLDKVDRRVTPVLLIEDDLLPAAHDTLKRTINFPCEIQTVRRGEMVRCDKLYYVSPFWYSLDSSRHRSDPYTDYAVDKLAVELVRNQFQSLIRSTPPTRRIFLPRAATQVRRIANAQEIETMMVANGFESLYAHDYSFAEQIALFSSARLVVGASGAAFSNLVFMQPGTKAVIISPKQLELFNYYIFQQQADVPGVELAHFLATPEKPDDFYVHNDFVVNCDDLQNLVRRLLAE